MGDENFDVQIRTSKENEGFINMLNIASHALEKARADITYEESRNLNSIKIGHLSDALSSIAKVKVDLDHGFIFKAVRKEK